MFLVLLFAVIDWTAVEQLVAQGRYAEAQTRLAQLPSASPRWHLLASKIFDGLGDPAAAVQQAENALALDPRSEAAHVQLGTIFLSHHTPEAALEVFTEARQLLPQSLLLRLGRGLALQELQRWDDAEADLSACLPHPLAYDALATILLQRGRFPELVRLAERFRESAPGDYRPWYFLAAAKEAQDVAGVEADLRESLRRNPRFAASHALLGKWLLKQGRAAEAVPELEQATQLRPDLVQAHLHLAQALQRLNRREEAARSFETVRQLKEKEKAPRQKLLFHRGAPK
jgi:tetratricopeptide (TPR) repeat protein